MGQAGDPATARDMSTDLLRLRERIFGLNSRYWRQVDRVDSPEFFVAYLDRAAAGLRTARVAMMRALEVSTGHSVLDIGSEPVSS